MTFEYIISVIYSQTKDKKSIYNSELISFFAIVWFNNSENYFQCILGLSKTDKYADEDRSWVSHCWRKEVKIRERAELQ